MCRGKIVGEIGSTKLDTNEAEKRRLWSTSKTRLAKEGFVVIGPRSVNRLFSAIYPCTRWPQIRRTLSRSSFALSNCLARHATCRNRTRSGRDWDRRQALFVHQHWHRRSDRARRLAYRARSPTSRRCRHSRGRAVLVDASLVIALVVNQGIGRVIAVQELLGRSVAFAFWSLLRRGRTRRLADCFVVVWDCLNPSRRQTREHLRRDRERRPQAKMFFAWSSGIGCQISALSALWYRKLLV